MNHYYVRVEVNANLAERELANEVSPISRLHSELTDYISEDCVTGIESFMTFETMDENEKAVEEKILEEWKVLYPDYENALRIYVSEKTGTAASDTVKAVYCGYIGWSEYMKLVTELADVIPLAKDAGAMSELRAMNYLVSIDDGCGMTTMTSSFGDFLTKEEFFDEENTSYSEYIIDEDEDHNQTTTKDLIDGLWDEDEYGQAISIDLCYFLDESKADELRAFLKRLYKLQDHYVFLFRIPYLADKPYRKIRDAIADILQIRELRFAPYSRLELGEIAYDALIKKNKKIDKEALELFHRRLEKEKMDGRFYGLKTVNTVIQEILWLKYLHDAEMKRCGETVELNEIHATDIEKLVAKDPGAAKGGFEELEDLIGMEEITQKIREIVAQVKVAMHTDTIDRPCLHMRFTGAPGTGKTTVARIVGKIFREEGILRKGNFFEYSGRSLCGQYVGQTAPRTSQICREAYGSVLFIDEAYTLYSGDRDNNDYGREALATLIAEMENHRDDLVVIMAGYTEDMDKLMEGNSGLRSRMPYKLEFKHYTKEQLAQIFMKMVRKSFECGDGLEEAVTKYFGGLSESYMQSKEFANARFARNLYERTWSKAALRVAELGETKVKILVEDFAAATREKEFSEKLMTDKKIGFQ